jgi:hypothetical protein
VPYVDLESSFIRIATGTEPDLTIGRHLGREIGGWLDWAALLDHRRVVLLAEAARGRTAEFRNTAAALCARGRAAFFLEIEQLADVGLEAALIHSTNACGDDDWAWLDPLWAPVTMT